MPSHFQSAFDLTAHPDRIQPAYAFSALFFLVGVALAVWATLAFKRQWRGRKRIAAFAAVWLCITTYVSVEDANAVIAVRRHVVQRAYTTVEGCLTYFHPGLRYGSKTMAGNERWSVGGYDFSYGVGEVRPGYHVTEPNGGTVHRDSRVRVSFVVSPSVRRTEIVRLDVAQHLCPSAADDNPNG